MLWAALARGQDSVYKLISGMQQPFMDVSAHLRCILVFFVPFLSAPPHLFSLAWPWLILASLTHSLPVSRAAPVQVLHSLPFCSSLLTTGCPSEPEVDAQPTALLCFCPQELLHYLIGTLLLLIASIVAASKSYNQSELVAAAVRTFWGAFGNEFTF